MMRTAHKLRPAIVYIATNKLNGKRYIGITCRRLCERRSKHFWSAFSENSQTYFHRAIRKYGKESFEFAVMRSCETYDEAARHEIALIAEISPEYNQSKGGDGYLGWSPSEEQRLQMSERRRGKPGPWKGKSLPKTFYDAGRRWNGSDEGKMSWTECAKLGPQSMQRSVVCLNDGLVYPSIRLAANAYGIEESSVSRVCLRNSNRRTAGNRVFRFFGEHHGGVEEALREQETARKNQLKHIANGYSRPVVCLEDGNVFGTIKEAAGFYGVHSGTVIAACKNRRGKYKTKNNGRFAYAGAAI